MMLLLAVPCPRPSWLGERDVGTVMKSLSFHSATLERLVEIIAPLSPCTYFRPPMADQRMDISSTISDFMSPGATDLLSSPLGTGGVDCNRKRKGSSTDYQ